MQQDPLLANAATAENELHWFARVALLRGELSFGNPSPQNGDIYQLPPPDILTEDSLYAAAIRQFNMNFAERFILALSLVPHLRPELLDALFIKNPATDKPYTELGGQKGSTHSGYLPTGETAVFLLAGRDLQQRFGLLDLFGEQHFFYRHNILRLQPVAPNEPRLSGVVSLSGEYLEQLTTGHSFHPDFSGTFPAKRITTGLDWEDLVVTDELMEELEEVHTWLRHGNTLLHQWNFGKKIKPGFRVLFSGPPGTGKTLTASLLGKSAGVEVYRVDLSMVVSKYIGETEKNLAGVFDQAAHRNWILFFDEADALFGKRTATQDSHDRYANQEVSYLLQRIEDYPGLVILATNFLSNIDDAFSRRFQLMIAFRKPDYHQRLRLWQQAFTAPCQLAADISLDKVAYDYEITGAAIMNVLRYCSLRALERGNTLITQGDLKKGIRRELHKEGKTIL